MRCAYRMLCSDLSVSDAMLYAGLPDGPEMIQLIESKQAEYLANDKEQCKIDFPELNS